MPHAVVVAFATTVLTALLTAAPAATRAPVTRGVTATTVVVGGLTPDPAGQGADLGARARFAGAGTVGGRRIDYLGASAATDPAAASQLTDRAFAVVPAIGVTADADTLARAHLPFVGIAASEEWVDNRWGYGITGAPPSAQSTTASPAWGVQLRALLGGSRGKTVTVVVENDAAGAARGRDARVSLRAAGFRVGAPVVLTAPLDPAAVARQLTAGVVPPPVAVVLLAAPTSSLTVAQQLAAAGYTGTVGVGDELYTPSAPSSGAGLTVLTTISPLESGTAAFRTMVADVHAVDPAAPVTPAVMHGYFAADFFLAVLQRVGRTLDASRFQSVANGGRFSYEVAVDRGSVDVAGDAHTGDPVRCARAERWHAVRGHRALPLRRAGSARPPRALVVVEAEPDLHGDLEPPDCAVVQRAADVGHLEPVQVAQRPAGAPDAVADGVVDALARRPDDLSDLVGVVHEQLRSQGRRAADYARRTGRSSVVTG